MSSQLLASEQLNSGHWVSVMPWALLLLRSLLANLGAQGLTSHCQVLPPSPAQSAPVPGSWAQILPSPYMGCVVIGKSPGLSVSQPP